MRAPRLPSKMASEMYVDVFLKERVGRGDYPHEAASLVRMMIDSYRKALRNQEWSKAATIGSLLLEAAKHFRDDPDYPRKFSQP